jgi:hypothetical protein
MRFKQLFIIIVLFVSIYGSIAADGGFFIEVIEQDEESQLITEHAQRAFLYYDEEEGLERIVIEAKTEEMTGSFAWFIPIPYVPSDFNQYLANHIDEVYDSEAAFDSLNDRAAPILTMKSYREEVRYDQERTIFGCFATAKSGEDSGSLSDAETEETGIEEIVWAEKMTQNLALYLVSGTVDQIAQWFYDHSFGVLSEEYREIFSSYEYEDDFSILLITGHENTPSAFHTGISITFPASQPFFPMRISGPGSGRTLDLVLYVCSDLPLKPDGLVKDYRAEVVFNAGDVDLLERDEMWKSEWHVRDMLLYGRPYYAADIMNDSVFWAECNEILTNVGLSMNGSLPSDTFWQQSCVLARADLLPFVLDITDPGKYLYLSRFQKAYFGRLSEMYPPAGLDDITFVQALQDEFRGEIRIHVLVDDPGYHSALPTIPDISFILPFLFPIWLKGRRLIKRRKRAGKEKH